MWSFILEQQKNLQEKRSKAQLAVKGPSIRILSQHEKNIPREEELSHVFILPS